MRQHKKKDSLFELIKVLTKAEKRNFKLYVKRQESNNNAKFVTLFETMESMEDYDEYSIISKSGVSSSMLSNIKSHLYSQILISLRLLKTKHSKSIELRQQIDFAKILYDKGLFNQSLKLLDKAKHEAINEELYIIANEIVDMEKNIEILYNTKSANGRAELLSMQSNKFVSITNNINFLSNISIQLYGLYLQLGFARSQRDVNLIKNRFLPRIQKGSLICTTSFEYMCLYNAQMLYTYILYDFLGCYKYSEKIITLFLNKPSFLENNYDMFLKAVSRNMESLYLIGDYKRLIDKLNKYENELASILDVINDNGRISAYYLLYINRVNVIFITGEFTKNIGIINDIESFMKKNSSRLGSYEVSMLQYKMACVYFGIGNYDKCLIYLQKIISIRDNVIRRDILCFARILNLIASYESGKDQNFEYQIKNVYKFLIKMNDMNAVQREIISFLKKLSSIFHSDVKQELKVLYDKLKQYEGETFEQRPFLYIDILSWLQSKIENKNIEQIVQEKFKKKSISKKA